MTLQLWLLIRIYLLENEFTPILNKLKLCNMIQILAVAFFHSGTIRHYILKILKNFDLNFIILLLKHRLPFIPWEAICFVQSPVKIIIPSFKLFSFFFICRFINSATWF
jgi:hypothetical protein